LYYISVRIGEKEDVIITPPVKYTIEPTKERTETTLPNLAEDVKKEAVNNSIQFNKDNKSIDNTGPKVKQKTSGKIDQAIVPAGSNFE
jgi:hypothetical protein